MLRYEPTKTGTNLRKFFNSNFPQQQIVSETNSLVTSDIFFINPALSGRRKNLYGRNVYFIRFCSTLHRSGTRRYSVHKETRDLWWLHVLWPLIRLGLFSAFRKIKKYRRFTMEGPHVYFGTVKYDNVSLSLALGDVCVFVRLYRFFSLSDMKWEMSIRELAHLPRCKSRFLEFDLLTEEWKAESDAVWVAWKFWDEIVTSDAQCWILKLVANGRYYVDANSWKMFT